MEGVVVLIVFTIISIVLLESMGDKHWAWVLELSIWKKIKKILKIFDYERDFVF